MATVILLHGIGQEQRSADSLENEWLPDLAGGIRNAGYPDLADQIWPNTRKGAIIVRMAFYGSRFLTVGEQGTNAANLTAKDQMVAQDLAWDWLNNASDSSNLRDSGEATLELQALAHGPDSIQGPRVVANRAISAVDRVPWFAQAGLHIAGKINKALVQVTRYLTDEVTRQYALEQVRQYLTPATKVVIGHSLGSVVAYEAVRELLPDQRLSLLVTLGSPLGLSAVNRRLRYPPSYPVAVAHWVNLADRNDAVAARPDHMNRLFERGRPPTARFDSTYTVDNGAQPHCAGFYLTKRACGHPVAEALTSQLDVH